MCKNLMRVAFLAWLISVCLNPNYSYAENIPWPNEKNISGKFFADGKPLTGQILQNAKSLNFLSNNWDIKYERYMIYELMIQHTSEYSIVLLSDDEDLGLTLIDSSATVVGVGEEQKLRKYKKVIKSELHSNKKYFVLIGSGTKNKIINFYISATYSINQPDIILPIKYSKELELKITKDYLNSNSMTFEGQRCEYYDLSKIKLKNKWLRICVESDSFDPVIYILNSENDVVAYNDDRSKINKNPEVTIGSDVEAKVLVVAAYEKLEFDEKKDARYNFVIKANFFNWNPKEGFLGILKNNLNNPFLTFSLGIIFTALIAWYFYWKSIRSKSIKYEELLDHTIINEDASEQSIKLSLGSENFSCASLYKFIFKGAGHSRIYNNLIREPLTLSLSNIKKILDLKSKSKGTGWKLPSIQRDTNIVINFNHIDPGDWIELIVIASQEYKEEKPLEVIPQVTGSISETIIKEEKDRIGSFLTAFEMTFALFFVFIGPLLLFDIYFDFMPDWWHRLFITVFPVVWGICLLYYFASKIGRERVISTAKGIYYHLKNLLPKKREKGEHPH